MNYEELKEANKKAQKELNKQLREYVDKIAKNPAPEYFVEEMDNIELFKLAANAKHERMTKTIKSELERLRELSATGSLYTTTNGGTMKAMMTLINQLANDRDEAKAALVVITGGLRLYHRTPGVLQLRADEYVEIGEQALSLLNDDRVIEDNN